MTARPCLSAGPKTRVPAVPNSGHTSPCAAPEPAIDSNFASRTSWSTFGSLMNAARAACSSPRGLPEVSVSSSERAQRPDLALPLCDVPVKFDGVLVAIKRRCDRLSCVAFSISPGSAVISLTRRAARCAPRDRRWKPESLGRPHQRRTQEGAEGDGQHLPGLGQPAHLEQVSAGRPSQPSRLDSARCGHSSSSARS